MHPTSVSWDITLLHLFSWTFIYFRQKEPIKIQIWWNFTWAVESQELVNFRAASEKSQKFTLMDYFCPNYMKFELKKYSGVTFHDTEQWCKIGINLDFVVSKMAWGTGWTFIRAPKSWKNCTLLSSLYSKHITFQLENFRGIMCHDTEECYKI